MKKTFLPVGLLLSVSILLSSCLKDLDRQPFYGLNSATLYDTVKNYLHVLAKIYAGFATTGNQGPAGQPDISGIDEGFSNYIRVYWNLQELPTDEAICAWNDPGIPELHNMSWSAENSFTKAMYYRIFFTIALCNEFIRECSEEKLSQRGFSEADKELIRGYQAEARFIRALVYYHALDLFGNVPFVTEADLPGSSLPRQIFRPELFEYVESELKAVENLLPPPRQNEYGRADQAAVWMTLAKLYLNAEVYVNQNRYTDCITYCKKVIESGAYSLEPVYGNLFRADNHKSNEIIFPIAFDGLYTQTYGGTTFLTHAPVGGTMNPADFGINGGWAGYRTTSDTLPNFGFAALFGSTKNNPRGDTLDGRNFLYDKGQNLVINSVSNFKDGLGITKWRNITSDGQPGKDATGNFVDTDYPLYRLADAYLMYAEAVLRGGSGGDMGTAINYINQLRERAYGNSNHNVSSIDLDFILNERGRELYWEATRRTDLIRYNRFTEGTYLWPWKGGVKNGTAVSEHLKLFPLAAPDIIANPNLKQNPGY
ncbi:MAG: RagB/SusD family nutrient uptake outer membrane protein [Chitinophagales bacterium]|nr:RagB/SusD family nutrient uptake outer membrane protein [Chitinophagales bacterium]MDW8427483.1 RagB/SusD family nutrient uptake outer membrane protein [Chitinophagales bacterium]